MMIQQSDFICAADSFHFLQHVNGHPEQCAYP